MASGLTAWRGFALPALPEGVSSAVEGIVALANTTIASLRVLQTALDGLANITIETDPTRLALNAAIDVLEQGLAALTQDVGVYVLYVPARRKVLIPPLLQEALTATGLRSVPARGLSADLLVLQAQMAAYNSDAADFLQRGAQGGNAGFFLTVAESVVDLADSNRPQFAPTDYVAGVAVLAGASDYATLLSSLAMLDGLLLPTVPGTALSAPEIPAPQDLRVRGAGAGVASLTWSAQPAFQQIPSLGVSALITEIAVIRTTDANALSAVHPSTLFGTGNLTVGLTAPQNTDTRVIAILDNTLAPTEYLDTGLTPGVQYFYFLAYRLKLGDVNAVFSGGAFPDRGFQRLSNVAVLTATAASVRSSQGVPPDWIRTPSVLSLVPEAADLTGLLTTFLSQLRSKGQSTTANIQAYAAFVQDELDRYSSLVAQAQGITARLTSLAAQQPAAGLYGRLIAGKGGIPFLLADLGESLSTANTDGGRPPFDRGDEFVSGAVIVAGGPVEAPVLAVQALLQALFSGTTPSPIEQAVAVIGAALAAEEAVLLGADLTVGAAPQVVQSLTNPPIGAEDPGNCNHPVELSLGDDLT